MTGRGRLAVGAAGVLAAAALFGSTQGGNGTIDVFVGSTPTPAGTPTGQTSVGNLWIDQNGGTCTRQSTAGAYVNAAACGSMQAAYLAASCGDIVGIKGGTPYTTESVNTASRKDCSSGSQYVTFTPATGENVVFGGSGVGTGEVDICSGTWIKLKATRTGRGSASTSNWTLLDNGAQLQSSSISVPTGGCGMGASNNVHHIWVEGMVFETFISRGGDNITFINNNIESGAGASDHFAETIQVTNGYAGGFFNNPPSDWLLDGNDIHGFTSELCRAGVSVVECHTECFTGAPMNIVFRNNWIYDCGNTAAIIFSNDGVGLSTKGTGNLLENNLIHDDENPPLQFGDTEAGSVITVRNNTIRRPGGSNAVIGTSLGGVLAGTINFDGNVIEGAMGASCADLDGTFTYNVIGTGSSGCTSGATNTVANTSFTGGIPDFHLAASQTAQDKIPSGSCFTSTDLDGEARPKGSACDSGADERCPLRLVAGTARVQRPEATVLDVLRGDDEVRYGDVHRVLPHQLAVLEHREDLPEQGRLERVEHVDQQRLVREPPRRRVRRDDLELPALLVGVRERGDVPAGLVRELGAEFDADDPLERVEAREHQRTALPRAEVHERPPLHRQALDDVMERFRGDRLIPRPLPDVGAVDLQAMQPDDPGRLNTMRGVEGSLLAQRSTLARKRHDLPEALRDRPRNPATPDGLPDPLSVHARTLSAASSGPTDQLDSCMPLPGGLSVDH